MVDNTLTRRRFLKLLGAGSAALAASEFLGPAFADSAGETRPNIIVILADDLGYGELGVQGSTDIPTPHIDSIAKNGVRFTSGYVTCPVCSPTRAGLLTGRYQERFGYEFNPGGAAPADFGLPLTQTTLASRLKAAGYRTGLVGKWHLGNTEKYRPLNRGFDEFFGFLGGAHSYVKPGNGINQIMRGNTPVDEKEYLTDAFAREATAFIERHKSEPFFLYLAFNSVHSPLQATDKYLNRFEKITDKKRRTFAAMLSAMDDAVGNVLATLRKNNLEDKTLIFFLSDNGGPTPNTSSNNGSLKGYKGQVYEGGIRVPFMMQWKGKLPAGKVYDNPVISLDIAATVLAAADIKTSDTNLDGVDIIPYVSGTNSGTPHDALYWRFGQQYAVRSGNWKLVRTPNGGEQLFDLATDIGEKTNLAAQKPEKLKELNALYAKWNSELATPLWGQRKQQPRNRIKKQVTSNQ